MALSFLEIWDRMVSEEEIETNQDPPSIKSPLMGASQDTRAMQVVRAGLNLRKEDDSPFWDDFMNLCSNPKGMAELLGVKESQVQTWSYKIRDILTQIEDIDQSNPEGENQSKVLPTGDQGGMNVQSMMQNA